MSENDKSKPPMEFFSRLFQSGEKSSVGNQNPAATDAARTRTAKEKLFDSIFGATLSNIPSTPEMIGEFCNGRYKIESLFDEGGLGALYLARDIELGRLVLVKGIRAERSDDFESQRQFVNEAAITGQLEHPGIVPIHGFGRDEHQRPYYAMHMIRGTKLSEVIQQFHALSVEDGERIKAFNRLLEHFRSVCLTIHFAHSRHVIHRDIKPDNVMVGQFGEVLVIDWGLAKHLSKSGAEVTPEVAAPPGKSAFEPISVPNAFQTRQGAVKGSPIYMSPEQSEGSTEKIGIASDVYSLGATLYELLTGRPPFDGNSADILTQVTTGPTRTPRQVAPTLPHALEAICLKAMQRDPQRRYATAKHLADDIENYVAGEPVTAYAEPLTDTARRWGRRHRTLVTSVVAAMLIAIVALGISSGVLTKYNRELLAAKNAADEAKAAERQRADALDKSLYVNQLMLAQTAWENGERTRTIQLLDATKPELRSLEWNYATRLSRQTAILPWHMSRPPGLQSISRLLPSANGAWLMEEEVGPLPGSSELMTSTHVISTDVGMPKLGMGAGFLAFSPDGSQVLRRELTIRFQQKHLVRLALVDIRTGNVVWRTDPVADTSGKLFVAGFIGPQPTTNAERVAATSEPKSQVVILTDPEVRSPELGGVKFRVAHFEFRDAQTGKIVKTIQGQNILAEQAIFSPDCQRVVARDVTGTEVLSVTTGKPLYQMTEDTGHFFCDVAFSPDSMKFAGSGGDRAIKIWDAATGKLASVLWGMRKRVLCIAFSPQGDRIAAGGEEGGIRVWNATTGELLKVFNSSDQATHAITFSHDGTRLYSGGSAGIARVWELDKPLLGSAFREADVVTKVRLSPNGDTLAAISGFSNSSKLRVTERATGRVKFEKNLYDPAHPSEGLFTGDIAFSPNGSTLAVGGDNVVSLLDANSGAPLWQVRGVEGPIAFTPDGQRLVALRKRQYFIQVIKNEGWLERIQGKIARQAIGEAIQKNEINTFFYYTGDEKLATLLQQDLDDRKFLEEVREKARSAHVIIGSDKGEIQKVLPYKADFDLPFVMHPQQAVLALLEKDKITLWDIESGKSSTVIQTPSSFRTRAAFSPDGRRLILTIDDKNTATIVDVAAGKVVQTLSGHDGGIHEAAYSSDGQRILTCAADSTLRIWDAATASLLWTIHETRLPLNSLSLSKDGRALAVGSGKPRDAAGGQVTLWDLPPIADVRMK